MIKLYRAALLAKRKFELRKVKKNILKRFARSSLENNEVKDSEFENKKLNNKEIETKKDYFNSENNKLETNPNVVVNASLGLAGQDFNKNISLLNKLNNPNNNSNYGNNNNYVYTIKNSRRKSVMKMNDVHIINFIQSGMKNLDDMNNINVPERSKGITKGNSAIKTNVLESNNSNNCYYYIKNKNYSNEDFINTIDNNRYYNNDNNNILNTEPLQTDGPICVQNVELENKMNGWNEMNSDRNNNDNESPERIGN